jgi:hypothetical protein
MIPSKPIQRALVFKQKLLDLGVKPDDIIFSITLTGNLLAGIRKKENEFLYFDLFGFLPSSSEIDLTNELNAAREYFSSLNEERKESFTNKNSKFYVSAADTEFNLKNLPELLTAAQLLPSKKLN